MERIPQREYLDRVLSSAIEVQRRGEVAQGQVRYIFGCLLKIERLREDYLLDPLAVADVNDAVAYTLADLQATMKSLQESWALAAAALGHMMNVVTTVAAGSSEPHLTPPHARAET